MPRKKKKRENRNFQNWLKSQGEFVDSREVIKFLEYKWKKERREESKAVVVRREIENSLKGREWIWIPVKVWKHEYYNF